MMDQYSFLKLYDTKDDADIDTVIYVLTQHFFKKQSLVSTHKRLSQSSDK